MNDDHTASRRADVLAAEAPHLLADVDRATVDRDDLPTRESAPLRIVELAEGLLGSALGQALNLQDDVAEIRRLGRWLFADAVEAAAREVVHASREAALVALFHDAGEWEAELARAVADEQILEPVRVTKRATAMHGGAVTALSVAAGFLTAGDVLVRLDAYAGQLWKMPRDEETQRRADELVQGVEAACAALGVDCAGGIYLWAGERRP